MAFIWTSKGNSEKHVFQKVLFEYYFELELNKNNLKSMNKKNHQNKSIYLELFNLWQKDACLKKAFEYKCDPLIKYLVEIPLNCLQDSTKLSNHVLLSKTCNCSQCKSDYNPLNWKKDAILFMAAETGVKSIINWLEDEKKFKLDILDCNKENALFYACKYKDASFIKWLIEDKKLDFCQKNNVNSNLLFKACYHDNLEVVKYLIDELNFDINFKNDHKQICIFACCYCETTIVFDYLVERFKLNLFEISDKYSLNVMLNSRNLPFLKNLISNYKFDINKSYLKKNQKHMIFYATSFENFELIDYTLQNSSYNIYNIDDKNNSIIYLSLIFCKSYDFTLEMIKYYKININHKNDKGKNMLFIAAENNHYDTIKFLIQKTNINVEDKNKDNYDIISDLIYYYNNENIKFSDFEDIIDFIFKNSKLKFNNKYLYDILTDKDSPDENIDILNLFINKYNAEINSFDKKGKNILLKSIDFELDFKFIIYLMKNTNIDIFHSDVKKQDVNDYLNKNFIKNINECNIEILDEIEKILYDWNTKLISGEDFSKKYLEIRSNFEIEKQSKLNDTINDYLNMINIVNKLKLKKYYTLEKKYLTIKNLYESELRDKNKNKDKLKDSGCDLNFDAIKLEDKEKAALFDDLMAYTSQIRLDLILAGKEPQECSNKKIDELF